MVNLDELKYDIEQGTPGPWISKYELADNGWYLDTDDVNTFIGVGVKCDDEDKPIAIVAVESLYQDSIVNANSRRIARVPEMEEQILKDAEALKLADSVADQLNLLIDFVADNDLVFPRDAEKALTEYFAFKNVMY